MQDQLTPTPPHFTECGEAYPLIHRPRVGGGAAKGMTMETEHNWTKPEPFDYQDGVLHRYIEGGRYGIIGTPGRSDWCVVYATDGVSVSETDPLCNDLTEDAAQREAETLEEEPEDDDQAE